MLLTVTVIDDDGVNRWIHNLVRCFTLTDVQLPLWVSTDHKGGGRLTDTSQVRLMPFDLNLFYTFRSALVISLPRAFIRDKGTYSPTSNSRYSAYFHSSCTIRSAAQMDDIIYKVDMRLAHSAPLLCTTPSHSTEAARLTGAIEGPSETSPFKTTLVTLMASQAHLEPTMQVQN